MKMKVPFLVIDVPSEKGLSTFVNALLKCMRFMNKILEEFTKFKKYFR